MTKSANKTSCTGYWKCASLSEQATHRLLKFQSYGVLSLKILTREYRAFLNSCLKQKGLCILTVCLLEQDLVLLEKENSWGCSHDCSNCHKLIKCFQLCLYCAIVYLACSHSAVGSSSKHCSIYYFCVACCPSPQCGFWKSIILTNISNLTFTSCLVNIGLENMLMGTKREFVDRR